MPKELDRAPLTGQFNTNYFIRGITPSETVLARVPRKNRNMMENLIDEYRQVCFFARGGRVRRRTSREQYEFGRAASMAGLRVLPPLSGEESYVSYPFLQDAVTLDTFFKTHPDKIDKITFTVIDDLRKAHRLGFIYGDRWSGNILIDPRFGVTHIDFDLEISGAPARELDVAQVVYHTLWASGGKALPILANLLRDQHDWFNFETMTRFMHGLAKFLNDTPVGGMEEMVDNFIKVTQSGGNGYNRRAA